LTTTKGISIRGKKIKNIKLQKRLKRNSKRFTIGTALGRSRGVYSNASRERSRRTDRLGRSKRFLLLLLSLIYRHMIILCCYYKRRVISIKWNYIGILLLFFFLLLLYYPRSWFARVQIGTYNSFCTRNNDIDDILLWCLYIYIYIYIIV